MRVGSVCRQAYNSTKRLWRTQQRYGGHGNHSKTKLSACLAGLDLVLPRSLLAHGAFHATQHVHKTNSVVLVEYKDDCVLSNGLIMDPRSCTWQCVGLKPDWAKGYSRLGAAHYGLQDYEEAVKAYESGARIAAA